MVFGWGGGGGGEIKNWGPSNLEAPSKKNFRKPNNFSGKYWGGEEVQHFFQTLGLHNGSLTLVLKIFLDQFSRKFLNI